MNFPREPKPVEVPGCALSVILFIWHQSTNGAKIDWISIVIFILIFLPWLGHMIDELKFKDVSVKFPSVAGKTPAELQHVTTSVSEFEGLSSSAKKILATLALHRKEHKDTWGFAVDPRNPEFLNFQAGLLELAQKNWIKRSSNGLVTLTEDGVSFSTEKETEISKYPDRYGPFVPIEKNG